MPARPTSAAKKGGKKGDKKGKDKGAKTGAIDPHQEQIDGLVREREEIRSKLNLVCTKIMENINLDDYKNEIDLTKQQPSDLPIDIIYSMIDQICFYRVAFLNLFQEADDNEKISVHKKITQLSVDDPDLFRKHLTSYQRLTFVSRERDIWKENAYLLHDMYTSIVDQLEMKTFQKSNEKTSEILKTHRLNLEDICLIFSLPRILSLNDAQKLRKKRPLSSSGDQRTTPDLDQLQKQQDTIYDTNTSSNESTLKSHLTNQTNISERRIHPSSSMKRTVSFADEVNVFNNDPKTELLTPPPSSSTTSFDEQMTEKDKSVTSLVNSSSLTTSNQEPTEERTSDSDYHSLSPPSSHQRSSQQQDISKHNLPTKYRLPLAKEVYVNKMDPNLRMLIIKQLSKNGHMERPLSRMSSARDRNPHASLDSNLRQQVDNSSFTMTPEWIVLARLVGIDEPEIEHWLSQNLQYPAGRVLSTWSSSESTNPTVAELHSLVSSNELNRHDLARYIETMYIIE